MQKTEEFLDIVDKNNNIIGQASRQNAHKNKLPHRASHIVIAYDNYIYLQLRSATKQQSPNKWDISASGHVKAGDTYYQAALTELKEELNLEIPTKQSLIEIGEIPASDNNGYEFVKIYYYLYSKLPRIELEPYEITSGGWFALDHISNWAQLQPQDFTNGFIAVWQVFIDYIKKS